MSEWHGGGDRSREHGDGDRSAEEPPADSTIPLGRRHALALLGVGGLASLAGCGDDGNGDPEGMDPDQFDEDVSQWSGDVNASGHMLLGLGGLRMGDDILPITDFAGENLNIDAEGVLNASRSGPGSIHVVTEYPGDTLDRKLRNVLESLPISQPGHRIVVPAPEPDSEAAVGSDPIWRFEEPVTIENNTGKLVFDFGWTMVDATASIDSFFVIGPDEKTENVTFNGGFFYARGNLERSFIDIQGIGHMFINQMYLQSLEGRNSVPAGIRLADRHGTSEVTINDTEVTGCTDAFYATQEADVPYGAAFDLGIYNWRGGGGETSIRIGSGATIDLHGIQAGGHPLQSVSDSIVKLENTVHWTSAHAVENVSISDVKERHNSTEYHSGVRAVDTTDGVGPRHEGIAIQNVDVFHAEYGTDIRYTDRCDQQNVSPEPRISETTTGTTRYYTSSGQVFDSTTGHTFAVDGVPVAEVHNGDLELLELGGGPIVRTPDGEGRYRIRVDDDGSLFTEAVDE